MENENASQNLNEKGVEPAQENPHNPFKSENTLSPEQLAQAEKMYRRAFKNDSFEDFTKGQRALALLISHEALRSSFGTDKNINRLGRKYTVKGYFMAEDFPRMVEIAFTKNTTITGPEVILWRIELKKYLNSLDYEKITVIPPENRIEAIKILTMEFDLLDNTDNQKHDIAVQIKRLSFGIPKNDLGSSTEAVDNYYNKALTRDKNLQQSDITTSLEQLVEPSELDAFVNAFDSTEFDLLMYEEDKKQFVLGVVKTIEKAIKDQSSIAIFLDTSARPVAHIFNEFFHLAGAEKAPKVKYLDIHKSVTSFPEQVQKEYFKSTLIDEENSRKYLGPDSYSTNSIKDFWANVDSIRKVFSQDISTNSSILVVDECTSSEFFDKTKGWGNTLATAYTLMRYAFPSIEADHIQGTYAFDFVPMWRTRNSSDPMSMESSQAVGVSRGAYGRTLVIGEDNSLKMGVLEGQRSHSLFSVSRRRALQRFIDKTDYHQGISKAVDTAVATEEENLEFTRNLTNLQRVQGSHFAALLVDYIARRTKVTM